MRTILSPQEIANLLRQPHPGLFSQYQPLHGRDWLRRVAPEDRRAFSNIGLAVAGHGVLGGQARANTAVRDHRGRFTSLYEMVTTLFGESVPMWAFNAIDHNHHSKFCLDHLRACYAYAVAWPNYCRRCNANGFLGDDPCPACVEQGQCPRCRALVWRDDGEEFQQCGATCPNCGWRDELIGYLVPPVHPYHNYDNRVGSAPILWACWCDASESEYNRWS